MISGLRRTSGSSRPGCAGRRENQLYPACLVQRARRLDQRRDRQPGIGRAAVVLRLLREFGEDLAAALRLAQQQRRVLGMRAVVGQIVHQLLGDDGDRRERAAELVRRRRGERADRRDPLLAGERQLRRGHRVAQAPRLLRDAPGIAADENRREHQRHPDARAPARPEIPAVRCATATACATGRARVIAATARIESAITGRRDRIVAATVTGARIRIENGFCSPPVRYSRMASCRMS